MAKRIVFTAPETVELEEQPPFTSPVGPDKLRGKSLVTMVSPGTELNYNYLGSTFPNRAGYAAVFEVTEIGEDVTTFKVGDTVFCPGGHGGLHEVNANTAVHVPDSLKPEVAVYARLMGVSMTTLVTTVAAPGSRVLVTGLGPVGNLAAQLFQRCGYQVTAADPVESRRKTALAVGLADVRAELASAEDLKGQVCLHLECSGHEQAVLDGCKLIRRKGECVLIGVPWSRRADLQAFEILHAVFHNYVNLRSGWEWEIPRTPEPFRLHSIRENFEAAMRWLAEGNIKTEGLATVMSPAQCQEAYRGLHQQSLTAPGVIFDWR